MSKGRGEEDAEQGELEACTPPGPDPGCIARVGTRNHHRWPSPSRRSEDAGGSLAPSRPPGPSAGQLARGVLCRRISSGAHTAALIRHTGAAFETGRAGRFPGKGWGKGHPQLLPESSSLSTGTNSGSNPPPQQAQCWGPGGPLPPRLTPPLGPVPALLPCSTTGCGPRGGDDGPWGLQAQVARPAVGFRFPIDSVTALSYVRKAGKAEQALARTEDVVSSADVEPMGYPSLS